MAKTRLAFYTKYSTSGAAKLAEQLGAPRLKRKTILTPNVVINWGRSEPITPAPSARSWWAGDNVLWINPPERIFMGADKLQCLNRLSQAGVPCLVHTTSADEAREWAESGQHVFARTTLNQSKGKGIELISPRRTYNMFPSAPLYTLGFNKTHEYRVHVFNGRVIFKQQKKAMGRQKLEEKDIILDRNIRNHDRGWVFAENDILWCPLIGDLAVAAVQALNLNMGGVDVLVEWSEDSSILQRAVICEVNTAPAIVSTKLTDAYVQAITRLL